MNTALITIRPATLRDTWVRETNRIANDNIRLSPNRAGEIAAARVWNLYAAQWAAFEAAMTARPDFGSLADTDPDIQIYDELYNWNPSRDLQDISGSRTILLDLNDPLAQIA